METSSLISFADLTLRLKKICFDDSESRLRDFVNDNIITKLKEKYPEVYLDKNFCICYPNLSDEKTVQKLIKSIDKLVKQYDFISTDGEQDYSDEENNIFEWYIYPDFDKFDIWNGISFKHSDYEKVKTSLIRTYPGIWKKYKEYLIRIDLIHEVAETFVFDGSDIKKYTVKAIVNKEKINLKLCQDLFDKLRYIPIISQEQLDEGYTQVVIMMTRDTNAFYLDKQNNKWYKYTIMFMDTCIKERGN